MAAIVRKSIAIIIITFGVIGLFVGAVSIIDPSGTQMANDNVPFATPRSLITSLLIASTSVVIIGMGVWVFRFRPSDVKLHD